MIWLTLFVAATSIAVVLSATPITLLTDLKGKISSSVNFATDSFQWQINSKNPTSNSVELIFETFSIQQAEFRIFDSTNLLYSCISCRDILPPPIYSKTGNIIITIAGSIGLSFVPSQFTLQYVCIPNAVTSALQAISINMNMAYAKLFPLFSAGLLPAGTTQSWLIQPSQNSKSTILFSFANFNFGDNCAAQLVIYDKLTTDGNVIFSGCRDTDKPKYWVYSYSGVALVRLTVGTADVNNLDFQLTYYADNDMFKCGSFLQPDVLADASMVLTDGSKSSSLMRTSAQCAWRIQPLSGANVNLIMRWVGIKYGSSVVVYDNSFPSGTMLWSGTGATNTVPPIITSTGGALYVVYQSDSTNPVSYRGFQGSYYSNTIDSVGAGSGNTLLAMSSALDVTAPGNTVTHTAGISYTWNVVPTGVTGPLTFAFSELNLLNSGDSLVLFDGPTANGSRVLGVFRGAALPTRWYKTSGSAATLVLQSAASPVANNGNFRLSYYGDGPNYHCGFTTNPASVTSQSMVLTDGSRSVEFVYSNQFCQWNIVPPGSPVAVYLFFGRFSVSGGTLSIYETSVTSQHLFAQIADVTAVPAPILVPFGSIGLEYTTRANPSGYGFALTYFGVRDGGTSDVSFPGDGTVRLFCSSMLSLVLALGDSNSGVDASPDSVILPNTNLTWVVSPAVSFGRVYLAFTSLSLPDCSAAYLDIYDGSTLNSPLLGRFCGSSSSLLMERYSWLQTTTAKALLNFVSSAQPSKGNFDLSFYSDGPNYHCGFTTNPARMTAPSMVFTDGSSSTEAMYSGQHCEWLIEPQLGGGVRDTNIVVEFLACDLRGGQVTVQEGGSSGPVLWSCVGCSNVPRPIISSTSAVFITYTSGSSSSSGNVGFGSGFQAIYWTVNSSSWRNEAVVPDVAATNLLSGRVLELPEGFEMRADLANNSAVIELAAPISTQVSRLQFFPVYGIAASSSDVNGVAVDGRNPSQAVFESLTSPNSLCGVLNGPGDSYVTEGNVMHYSSTQLADRFLLSKSSYKSLTQLAGKRDTADTLASSSFSAPSVCKYHLDTGNRLQAISIQLLSLSLTSSNGRLRIYGGVTGTDALLYDSNADKSKDRSHLRLNVTAPCGKCTIILESNATNTSTPVPDYAMDLTYQGVDFSGFGVSLCDAYIQSLLPVPKETDPYVPFYIGGAAVVAFCAVCVGMYYASKRKAKKGYVFFPDSRSSRPRKYLRITPNHPRYSKKWDSFRNRFLSKGFCSICKSVSSSVYFLSCSHAVCVEDMESYLASALGDISTFPVKCPMHFEGCTGTIGAKIAKRVLVEPQYNRFLEFSDRAIYGDGMRCIFCNNFVNFPENMNSVSRVECPYCVQLFCVRCKKPWHHGVRCMAEKFDDSLEVWKANSGAQKCPACRKIIEKDDPETCHHMVHKITDGIPCVRDRTDFCYLCGEEVTPNYPHEEAKNLGVNHFPQGVFQKCRHVLLKEKEEERERLKKLRRMKAKSPVKSTPLRISSVVPTDDESWRGSPVVTSDRTTITTLLFTTTEQLPQQQLPQPQLADRFDEQWDRALMDRDLATRNFQRHRLNTN